MMKTDSKELTKSQKKFKREIDKPKLIIVEDEPTITLFYQAFFERKGYDIRIFSNIKEAEVYLYLNDQDPLVLLLDLNLEGDGGLDLIDFIKSFQLEVGIFVISAFASDEDIKRQLEIRGVNDIYPKNKFDPFNFLEDLEKIERKIQAYLDYCSYRFYTQIDERKNEKGEKYKVLRWVDRKGSFKGVSLPVSFRGKELNKENLQKPE